MFRKHKGEGRFSATGEEGTEYGAEGRMSATPGAEATGYPEGRMSATGTAEAVRSVPSRTGYETRPGVGERMGEVGERAGETLSRTGERVGQKVEEIKDVTAEKLGRAGEAVGEGLRQVDIEEFRLRGTLAGHPFRLDLEGETEERFLAFEVNFETDQGDVIRFSGRKRLGGQVRGSFEGRGLGGMGYGEEGWVGGEDLGAEGRRLPEGSRIRAPGVDIETRRSGGV